MILKGLLKYGRSFKKVKERYKPSSLPYDYIILKEFLFIPTVDVSFTESCLSCFNFEIYLHKIFNKFKYNPILCFQGETECFDLSIKTKILEMDVTIL